ncbi:MAG: hypothetical protein JO191_04530 [Mycobacteriaceae bacterium]|nr:hypothetical protein [Mycobacteriaceae bacterium]
MSHNERMATRLLLGAALAVTLVPAARSIPASADVCSQNRPPLDAASKEVGHGDMLWISHTGAVGVTVPAGTGVVQVADAGPLPLQALLIDAQQNGQHQLIVSNGRGAHLYLVSGCDITPAVDQQGEPFLFDLENLRGTGTGVGCADLGDGRHLVGLQAVLGPTGWTVHRTQIDFDGATAKLGRSDTVAAQSAQDPAVAEAQTITCGDQTISKDGVQQP